MDVDVLRPLFGDGRLEGVGTAAPGIVVAHKEPGWRRQFEKPLDGTIKRPRIAAREIASRRSIVWHEERVPDEKLISAGV